MTTKPLTTPTHDPVMPTFVGTQTQPGADTNPPANTTKDSGRWTEIIENLPHPPRQLRGKNTVAALLDASETAITERGIERFTTGDVARIAGLSIGTVYKYFADRVAILDAIRPHRYDDADTLPQISQLLEDLRSHAHDQLDDHNQKLLDGVIALTKRHPRHHDI